MLDAYIIDKLNRERERQEQQNQWQPIPLPLEEYDRWEQPEPGKKEEEKDVPRGFVILRLGSATAMNDEE
jgi:hypothetical protein